jgi:ADP-heptose:LPS heptosyltransferase
MDTQESQKNILVIRSATRILNQTLLSLKEEFPECRITVLAPESAREAVEQDPLIDEVLTITDQRRMSVSSYGTKNIACLRGKKFDLAVHELAPVNKALIEKRETIQKKIDDFLDKNLLPLKFIVNPLFR